MSNMHVRKADLFPVIELGRSVSGRTVKAYRVDSHADPDHGPIVVVAGQHGDEPLARIAAWRMMQLVRQSSSARTLWFLPNVNPDGAFSGSRELPNGLDLNRDHLARRSVESKMLHQFLRHIGPSGLIDIHTCPARRAWMKTSGMQHAADCMVDGPSGPAKWISGCDDRWLETMIDTATSAVAGKRYACSRYWLRSGRGRVRHSTPDWLDLRNQAAATCRCPTVLIEGLQPHGNLVERQIQAARTIGAIVHVAIQLIENNQLWQTNRASQNVGTPVAGEAGVPLQYRYRTQGAWIAPMKHRASGRIAPCRIEGRYSGRIEPRLWVEPACEFFIPTTLVDTLDHLRRLNAPLVAAVQSVETFQTGCWRRIRIESARSSSRPWRSARNVSVTESDTTLCRDKHLDGFRLVPDRDSAAYWSLLLDPRSKYGLARYYPEELLVQTGVDYPVLFRRRQKTPPLEISI